MIKFRQLDERQKSSQHIHMFFFHIKNSSRICWSKNLYMFTKKNCKNSCHVLKPAFFRGHQGEAQAFGLPPFASVPDGRMQGSTSRRSWKMGTYLEDHPSYPKSTSSKYLEDDPSYFQWLTSWLVVV